MKPKTHMVEGREMTIRQIADMLGIAVGTLTNQKYRHGCSSYARLVEMYKSGEIHRRVHTGWRHKVHGRWTTVQEEADRLGLKRDTIYQWMFRTRKEEKREPLLEECVDHYEALAAGRIQPKRKGPKPKLYRVNGREMTIGEAAALAGMTREGLRQRMAREKCSVNAAVKRALAYREKMARCKIMHILNGDE